LLVQPFGPSQPPEDDSGTIGLCEPDVGDAERLLVLKALESTKLAYGPIVDEFEGRLARLHGRRHGVALASGTAALHLALLAAGVQRGEEVLMPTLTFVAPANAVVYAGARPLLFDAEPDYRQIDVERLKQWVAQECRSRAPHAGVARAGSDRRIAAVMGVDLLGHPCDLDGLRAVADELGVPLVLDSAESLGAQMRGRATGDVADFVCLSFNVNKMITTGGGGMVLCDEEERALTLRHLANQAKVGGPYYVHDAVGFNYRMGSAQAALGNGQLRRLEEFRGKKREIAAHYTQALSQVPGITVPREAPWCLATHWLYTVHVEYSEYGYSAEQLARQLALNGIDSRPIFTPLHSTGVHAGREAHPCTVAERLAATGLTLPSSTRLEPAELTLITDTIRDLRV
jgi:perosamine synthetase